MIDGKPYKTLRRHLATNGLTPEEYRDRYGLRPDYPMVSETYSESRRAMAKKIGLGRKPGKARRQRKPPRQKRSPLVRASRSRMQRPLHRPIWAALANSRDGGRANPAPLPLKRHSSSAAIRHPSIGPVGASYLLRSGSMRYLQRRDKRWPDRCPTAWQSR